ncbi:MAG TPA: hypothetical protein VJI32_03095 [Candidatus Nanoarchaeia archaeon]|nr:hypothetical protein [Candidatus Nanoarchaeia archaeon]
MLLNDRDLEKTLKTILYLIKLKHFIWRLDGSTNLHLQNVPTPVNDIDICTNSDGYRIFKKALEEYPQKEGYNERIATKFLKVNMNGVELEVSVYDQFELRMFDRIVQKSWTGMNLPILPLKDALTFYQQIHRLDKVDLLERYLKEQ